MVEALLQAMPIGSSTSEEQSWTQQYVYAIDFSMFVWSCLKR